MKRIIAGLLWICTFLSACSEQECREQPQNPPNVNVNIERLDLKLFEQTSPDAVLDLLNANRGFSKSFIDIDQYPSEAMVANRLFGLINDPYIDTLYQETQAQYADFSSLQAEFEMTFANIKSFYPSFEAPRIQTAITGLYKDLLITDSLIVIGLDHFLGSDATFKPIDVPDYILERYTAKHMVPIIATVIGGQYNNVNFDNTTMLAEMIDYGKSYYFASRVMPCTRKNIIIGYTEKEWEDAAANDRIIWANIIENELLYETNHQLKNKFLGERPNVFEIGENCPGRIGRWVGWQIVEAYMDKNQGISLNGLMANNNALEIFQSSQYKPSN